MLSSRFSNSLLIWYPFLVLISEVYCPWLIIIFKIYLYIDKFPYFPVFVLLGLPFSLTLSFNSLILPAYSLAFLAFSLCFALISYASFLNVMCLIPVVFFYFSLTFLIKPLFTFLLVYPSRFFLRLLFGLRNFVPFIFRFFHIF